MEEETGIITGVETTPANATDGSHLQPMLKAQEKVYSLRPQELTADKAYIGEKTWNHWLTTGPLPILLYPGWTTGTVSAILTSIISFMTRKTWNWCARPDISQPAVTAKSFIITNRVTPSHSSQVYAIPVRLKLNASRIIRVGESLSVIMSHTSGFKNLLGNSATARKQQNLQTVSSPTQITNEIPKGISSNPLLGRDWVAQHRDALSKADFSKLTM